MKDKMFILSAVTIELFYWAKKNKEEYLDQHGMAHFYDMCADIVNEMLDGVEYQKFLIDRDYFNNQNKCFDWYYMDIATSIFTNERIRKVSEFGVNN
jgi:predicted glycoside hydrolase/deacetylase ChbG (UPF0249 family)